MRRRFALRRADLDDAVCPVPEELAEALHDRDTIAVTLQHGERAEVESVLEQDVGWRLTGIAWPADVQPGVLVTLSVKAPGEVLIRTTVSDEPIRIDGVDYFHDYDAKVVTREYDPGRSNHGRVLSVVRRLGRVFDDGSAVFAEAEVGAHAGLGRGAKGKFLLANAVDQLIREGYVTRVTGSLDPDGQPSYPAVDGEETAEMLFYAPLIEPVPSTSERSEHWVNGFVRKLPPGAQPSEKQVELHSRLAEENLEPGYTFVKRHHRSG